MNLNAHNASDDVGETAQWGGQCLEDFRDKTEMVYAGTCCQWGARSSSGASNLFSPRANSRTARRVAGPTVVPSHQLSMGQPRVSWFVGGTRRVLLGRPLLWLKKTKSVQLNRLNGMHFDPQLEFLPPQGCWLLAWPLAPAEGQEKMGLLKTGPYAPWLPGNH